jgi:hypothetical protein
MFKHSAANYLTKLTKSKIFIEIFLASLIIKPGVNNQTHSKIAAQTRIVNTNLKA